MTCLRGNQISEAFQCVPPTLEEYLESLSSERGSEAREGETREGEAQEGEVQEGDIADAGRVS